MRRLLGLLAVVWWTIASLAVAPSAASADPLAASFDKLAADSFADTAAAVTELAASGDPRTLPVLEALRDGRLLLDATSKAILIKDASGKLADARTGKPAASPPAELSTVRLNNRVRGAIEQAMSGLTLAAADPRKRLEAAQGLFKSKDGAKLSAIETALAKEQDERVKAALEQARAVIVLASADAKSEARLAAIAVLKSRGDQDATVALKGAAAEVTSPEVKDAARAAVTHIERRLVAWGAAQNVWYGISLGSVLLLAAVGLAITFGVMGIINMAHGEMVMLGAYTTFAVQEVLRARAPWLMDASLLIAVPAAFLVAGAVGLLIERGLIRHLYGRPLETLLATFGLSLILQQAVRSLFGPTNREVSAPSWMSGAFELGGLSIAYGRLWIIVFTALVFAGLLATIRATPFGLYMRAVTQNRRMAGAMGIATPRIDALAFALGCGIAGIAGVALSQIDNVSPNLGQSYIIDSFLVVVFGGVGNLWGTLVGALTLGIANKFLEPFAGAVLGKILLLVLVILFIQKRPRGMFALKGRAVEA
jgi:urea transport system permease protein